MKENIVFVYISTFDGSVAVREVQPTIRNEQIQRCGDTLTRQQRYCVWRLLDYALNRHLGKGVSALNFTVSNGKWQCDGAYFSLTHCNNVVAVAVCSEQVGVDLEAVARFVHNACDNKFVTRTLTDCELNIFEALAVRGRTQALAEMWTQKESLFKLAGGDTFAPKSIDTTELKCRCQTLQIDGADFALSVSTASNLAVTVQLVDIAW